MSDWIYKIDNLENDNNASLLNETIFHNANGYLGVRSCFEEGYSKDYETIRGTYINGVYNITEMKQAEQLYGFVNKKQTIVNVVDTQGIQLWLDDEKFNLQEGNVVSHSRSLDMKNGYTVRKIIWKSPKGKIIQVSIKRMASFIERNLFTIEYKVKSINFDGIISILSTHIGDVRNYSNQNDPRVADEAEKHLVPKKIIIEDDMSCILSETTTLALKVCSVVKNVCLDKINSTISKEKTMVLEKIEAEIDKDETVILKKFTVLTDSRRTPNCLEEAKEIMNRVTRAGLTEMYHLQKIYLDDFWNRSNLEIDGNKKMNLAIKYNLFQLLQSIGKDEYCSIAAKGLSGEGYEGHYFWDSEIYIFPFFLLTNPQIARNLLEYRYNILDSARENARILGHSRGALYPWRTIAGEECSGYFLSGSAQYHINSDIAYAVVNYYLATKDLEFIVNKGLEILLETARLWLSVGHYYQEQFHIMAVTGPDEYTCMVNDNYYTNASAQYNLRWAAKLYGMLKQTGRIDKLIRKIELSEEEVEAFVRASEKMYLPYSEEMGINPQDSSFLSKPVWDFENTPKENYPLLLHYHPLYLNRFQVCKQADTVLAYFLYEDTQTLDVMKKSFDYYEKITTHDSSLSTCIFSIIASKLGLLEKAVDYMGDSVYLDLYNTHKNTKDGIHTANMGGAYMTIVYGLAGLRIKEDGIYLSPLLPVTWKGYKFKIMYEGFEIVIEVDEVCKLTCIDGENVSVYLYGKQYILNNNLVIELQK